MVTEQLDAVIGVDTHTAALLHPTGAVNAATVIDTSGSGYQVPLDFAQAQAPGPRLLWRKAPAAMGSGSLGSCTSTGSWSSRSTTHAGRPDAAASPTPSTPSAPLGRCWPDPTRPSRALGRGQVARVLRGRTALYSIRQSSTSTWASTSVGHAEVTLRSRLTAIMCGATHASRSQLARLHPRPRREEERNGCC